MSVCVNGERKRIDSKCRVLPWSASSGLECTHAVTCYCSEDPSAKKSPSLSLNGRSVGGALALSAHTLASDPAVILVN